jgi:hypothetical protein
MSGPDGIAGDRLLSFVERIERIDEDLKAMNDERTSLPRQGRRLRRQDLEGGHSAHAAASASMRSRSSLPAAPHLPTLAGISGRNSS